MTRPATVPISGAETVELPPLIPANLPPRLQALLRVHYLVTSRRWQLRRRSPDGSLHYLPGEGGPMMRVRTEQLTPVPTLERTTP